MIKIQTERVKDLGVEVKTTATGTINEIIEETVLGTATVLSKCLEDVLPEKRQKAIERIITDLYGHLSN